MIITTWILFIAFGIFALDGFKKYFFGSLNKWHSLMWFISIIITAISAGAIWGGLLDNIIK